MDLQNASGFGVQSLANISTIPSLTALQTIVLLIFVSSSLIALAAYVLVLAVLYLYFKEFKSNFYYLVISLALVDMGFLVMVLVYMVPSTILHRNILPRSVWPGLISGFCFSASCTHLAFIGISRLISVSVPPSMNDAVDQCLNNKPFMIICSIVFWLLGPTINLVSIYVQGCVLLYDEKFMAFALVICDAKSSMWVDDAAVGILIASWLVPCSIAASHLLTWIVVYAKGVGITNEIQQKRKRERILLIQFTLISTATLLYDSSFWFVPKVFANHPEGFVLITMFGIASTAVNPFTYLVYNTLMKKKAKYLVFVVILRRPGNAIAPLGIVAAGLQPKANERERQNQRW